MPRFTIKDLLIATTLIGLGVATYCAHLNGLWRVWGLEFPALSGTIFGVGVGWLLPPRKLWGPVGALLGLAGGCYLAIMHSIAIDTPSHLRI